MNTTAISYVDTIAKAIEIASEWIDEELDQPNGFFTPGGVELSREYHDGVDVGDYGLIISFGLSIKRRPFLRLKYSPVLSVTTFEEETSAGTWTTRTEGRTDDYLVMDDGVRLLHNVPKYKYKNIRVTYKAGYQVTPKAISKCCARLSAAIYYNIVDSTKRDEVTAGPLGANLKALVTVKDEIFSEPLKKMIRGYKRKIPVTLL